MNFTAAVNEAMGVIQRPDKILDMRREINAAVNFYCQDSDFKRDVEEVLLPINPLEFNGNLPYTDLPRFRKFRYIRAGNCMLEEILTSKISSAASLCNKYYLAGSGIRYNLRATAANLDIAYYQYPPILTDLAPDFWMLEMSPYMIIDRALSKVFNNIGDDASSRRHEGYANVAYLSWRGDQLAS